MFRGTSDYSKMKFKSRGKDVKIFPKALIINPQNIEIGDAVQIDDYVKIVAGPHTHFGSFVHVGSFSSITGRGHFWMGDYTALSLGVRVFTGNEHYTGQCMTNPTVPAPYRTAIESFVKIGDHAIIGANAVILPPATIGEGTVVGANSLVKSNSKLEDWGVYVGSPVRRVGIRPRERILELAEQLRKDLYRNGKYVGKNR